MAIALIGNFLSAILNPRFYEPKFGIGDYIG